MQSVSSRIWTRVAVSKRNTDDKTKSFHSKKRRQVVDDIQPKLWQTHTTVWMYYLDANKMHGYFKLDGNYTRILCENLNQISKQQPTKQQLYGYLPPISHIIPLRRTQHTEHCWRNKNKLLSVFLFWSPIHLCANVARGVIVIVVGNEHGDTSSNPGRDWLHFT